MHLSQTSLLAGEPYHIQSYGVTFYSEEPCIIYFQTLPAYLVMVCFLWFVFKHLETALGCGHDTLASCAANYHSLTSLLCLGVLFLTCTQLKGQSSNTHPFPTIVSHALRKDGMP